MITIQYTCSDRDCDLAGRLLARILEVVVMGLFRLLCDITVLF